MANPNIMKPPNRHAHGGYWQRLLSPRRVDGVWLAQDGPVTDGHSARALSGAAGNKDRGHLLKCLIFRYTCGTIDVTISATSYHFVAKKPTTGTLDF
jgi:hypothetical protein